MFSRRRFLKAGVVATASGAIVSQLARGENANALPPAIAGLKSTRGEARPIASKSALNARKKRDN